jgi:multiple sugar transport system permease protein
MTRTQTSQSMTDRSVNFQPTVPAARAPSPYPPPAGGGGTGKAHRRPALARLPLLRTLRDGSGFDVVLVLCAVGYLLVFAAFPLVYTLVMSLQQVDMFSLAPFDRPFAGLDNYRDVFSRPEALQILKNTVIFVVLSITFQLSIGFGLALFFQQPFPGATYIRGVFLAGWIMPALVVGAIWKWILAGDFGVLNYALTSLHLTGGKIFWLSDPDVALFAVIIANIWLGIPFNMILLSVGLAAIPRDLYEAAEIDGARAGRRFLHITLPLMRSTLGAVVSLGIIFTLQQFDLIAAMTKGGPANASNVAQYWSWQMSFETYEISAGSVVAVLMIALVILVAALYVRSTEREHAA